MYSLLATCWAPRHGRFEKRHSLCHWNNSVTVDCEKRLHTHSGRWEKALPLLREKALPMPSRWNLVPVAFLAFLHLSRSFLFSFWSSSAATLTHCYLKNFFFFSFSFSGTSSSPGHLCCVTNLPVISHLQNQSSVFLQNSISCSHRFMFFHQHPVVQCRN